MTKDSSWCPRQMPKTGLGFSTQTTFLTLSMVVWQSWGSPGPLLMNKPSKSTKGQEKNPMKVGHDKREQTVGGSETIFCSTSGIRSDGERPLLSSGWSQGTTVTRAPLWARQRIWLYLMPQSTTVICKLPLGLKTLGSWRQRRSSSVQTCVVSFLNHQYLDAGWVTFMETSWTRFLLSGLSKGTLSSGVPSTTSFPNMVPFSLIFLVRQRVSMPEVHGNNR